MLEETSSATAGFVSRSVIGMCIQSDQDSAVLIYKSKAE